MGRLGPELDPVAVHLQADDAPVRIALDVQARQIRVAPGMAQDDRQAQRHELLHKPGVLQFGLELAQLAPVAQHQLTQAVQLVQGEARQVGVVQDVGAVFVVIAVRDAHARFVQLAGPVQFLQMALAFVLRHIGSPRCDHGLQQALGCARDPFGLLFIGAKALG